MRTYDIVLARGTIETAYVTIGAVNQPDACEQALHLARNGQLDWEAVQFATTTEPYINSCEELPSG